MVTILHYNNNEIRRLTLKELAQVLQKREGILWVDMEDPNEAEEETVLVSLLDMLRECHALPLRQEEAEP